MYGKIETKGDYSVKLIASHEATDFLNVLYIRHLFTFLACQCDHCSPSYWTIVFYLLYPHK